MCDCENGAYETWVISDERGIRYSVFWCECLGAYVHRVIPGQRLMPEEFYEKTAVGVQVRAQETKTEGV